MEVVWFDVCSCVEGSVLVKCDCEVQEVHLSARWFHVPLEDAKAHLFCDRGNKVVDADGGWELG